MTLDKKVLADVEAAAWEAEELGQATSIGDNITAYLEHPNSGWVERSHEGLEWERAVECALKERDEARQKLAEARSHWSKVERERDEARREAEELKTDIISYIKVASDQAEEIVEQSQHQAALCDVLTVCEHVCSNTVADYDNPKGHKAAHREAARRARAALTDTAEAKPEEAA